VHNDDEIPARQRGELATHQPAHEPATAAAAPDQMATCLNTQLSSTVPFVDLVVEMQTCTIEWEQRTTADHANPERNESRLQALKVVHGAKGYLEMNDAPERVEDLRAMHALLNQLTTVFARATQRAEEMRAGDMPLASTRELPHFRVSGTVLVCDDYSNPTEISLAITIAANTPERAAWLALRQFSKENRLAQPITTWYEGPTTERIAP